MNTTEQELLNRTVDKLKMLESRVMVEHALIRETPIPDPATRWAATVLYGIPASEGEVCPSTMCGPDRYSTPNAVPVGYWLAGDVPTRCEICSITPGRINVTGAQPGLLVQLEGEYSHEDCDGAGYCTLMDDILGGADCKGTGWVTNLWLDSRGVAFSQGALVGAWGELLEAGGLRLRTMWVDNGSFNATIRSIDNPTKILAIEHGTTQVEAALNAVLAFAGTASAVLDAIRFHPEDGKDVAK